MYRNQSLDTLNQILQTFIQFEKKLDKLQDEVSHHGHTLTDLHVMIANLSGGTLYDARGRVNVVSKTTGEDNLEVSARSKRKSIVQTTSPKAVTKSYQSQKLKPPREHLPNAVKKMSSFPKTSSKIKRAARQRKGEFPRKATTLRPKKVLQKKSKNQQQSSGSPLVY
ncbi:uncharacterized protein LOC112047683 [Bicyclus anynana]|uniref:Uncharacterized protein LOC112047683 n=1 Tax=Bicyclus anynana TaxID=110368 RepID=A0A6J1N6D6_BICAN|nr:uncharacterized protein LOC112047683 [Bicyclus anynana]